MVSAELDADRWAEHVFLAFEAVVKLAPVGRELVGWWELTRPPPSNGWMGNAMLSVRVGALAGRERRRSSTAGFAHVMPQTWATRRQAPVGKRGDGSHRRSRRRRSSRWTRTPSGARRWRGGRR